LAPIPTSAEVKRGWRRRAGTNSAIRFSLFIGETKKIRKLTDFGRKKTQSPPELQAKKKKN
jgi:hypothetical protein